MCVEGVIQKNVSLAPIPAGITLYHSLLSNFNVLLYSSADKKSLDYWTSLEALTKHAATEYNEGDLKWLTESERKLKQVNNLRNRGFSISLVIEPDPECSVVLIDAGYSVMTFTHAQYSLPQWRPDYSSKPKPWDEFSASATRIAELRAIDERMKDLDEVDYR